MSETRITGRRAALLIALLALGLGTTILAGRAIRERRGSGVTAGSRSPRPVPATAAPPALRVESFGRPSADAAPHPLRSARPVEKAAKGTTPLRDAKIPAPLMDAPTARETTPPEERSPGSTQKSILLSREDLLKERDGVYGFATRAYGATLGNGKVEFALPLVLKESGQPRLSYDFVELLAGGVPLALGGPARARAHPEERSVSFDRGSVEERYLLRPEALEQTFIVRSLPPARGAIEVTGRISTNLTPPQDVTSGPKLSFTAKGHEILTMSEAVALDAAGRRKDLELSYSNGMVTMTVPAEWVAGAALPIVIDPLMGGPVTIDSSVTDAIGLVHGVPVRITDVAHNAAAGEWLVVWQEQFGGSAFNYDVYGQRVSATGNLVGSAIPLSVTGAGEYEATISLASSANRYLVSWRHDPADDASDADQFIAGCVLNSDGTLFAPAFALDDAAGQDFGPSLMFDGTRWLCVFTNVAGAGDTNVLGRFVTTAGVPDAALTLDIDLDLAAAPSADVVGGIYLIAWQKGAAGGPMSIVARLMDGSGAFLTPVTTIDQSVNACIHPDVSAGGGQFLVAWQQTVTTTDHNVVGRLVTTSMTFPKNAFNIRAGLTDQLTPRAQFSATSGFWYVVYSDTRTGNTDLYGNRVDTTGKVFGANRLTTDAVAEVKPELAWNSATDEMLVVYLYGAASPFQIRAQRVSMDFTAPSIPGTPVVTPNPSSAGTFTVTWSGSIEGGASGFSNYDLQRSANGGLKWGIVASPTTESYVDTVPHGDYLYRVRASDLAGNNSAYSPFSALGIMDSAAPAEPFTPMQAKSDGTTPIPVGGTSPDSSVVLSATAHDLGLLDGFEDANFTVDPNWVTSIGSWAIATDGFKVLQDGADLDNVIYTTAGAQAYGSWEYRFRFSAIATGANLQAGFYLFMDSAGLGGNGYEVLVTGGSTSTKTVSLYQVQGTTQTRLIGADANWTPTTTFHVLRVNRAPDGRFDLYLDGVLVGSAVENAYTTAVSTVLRHTSTNTNKLRIDYLRASSAPAARSNVKLQVEVKPVGTAFDGAGLVESALVASGSVVSVVVPAAVGSYHWRSRVVDELGNAGPFTSFGGNPESDADFTRIPASPPPPPSTLMATAGDAQVVLTWVASSGATSYTVKRSLIHDGPYSNVASGLTDLTFTDVGLQNGTTYYYVVTAVGPGGESVPSNEASATPQGVPDAPAGLTAFGGNNQVFLSWGVSSGTVTYIVKRATQAGGSYATLASGVVPATYTDNAVVNGTPYYYVVCAQNGAGISAPSNEASATPSGPPPVPTNFTGVAQSLSLIEWSWSDVTGEAGFRLHDDAHVTIASSGADVTSITEGGLSENTSYSRHVHAVFGAVPGGASNTKIRSTLVHDAQAADFILTRAASAQINVAVTPPPNGTAGNTGVQIERSTDGVVWTVVKPFSKVYLHKDVGLSPTTTYSYRIQFQNADAVASQVSPAAAAAAAPLPAAPVLTVAPLLTTMLQLSWNNVADNQGYEVHDENHGSIGTTGPQVNLFTRVGLSENTPYTMHLHALGPAGTGPASNAVTTFTGVHGPGNFDFTLTSISPSQIQIAVVPPANSTSGQTGCEIQRQTDAGWVILKPFSNSYSFVDALLAGSTNYIYRIRFRNGDGVATADSPQKNLVTPPTTIASPANFTGTAQSTSSILWTWDDVVGETGFVLKDGAASVIATLGPDVLSYLESALFENTAYSRRVFAQAGDALGADLASATRYTLVHDATGLDFTATVTSMSSVDFTFVEPPGATSGATGVLIERSTDGTTWTTVPSLAGVYLFSDTGLLGNTTYHYRFRYMNGNGTPSGVSPVKTVTTPEATVGPVANLTAAGGNGQISLQWTANAEPALAGYNVYRSGTSGGPYSKINGALVTSISYVDQGLPSGETFYYVVRAQASSGGEGANSNQASATSSRPPETPLVFDVRGLSASSVGLNFITFDFWLFTFELHDDAHTVKATHGPLFGGDDMITIVETGLSENTRCSRHVHSIKQDGSASAPSNTVVGYSLVHDALVSDFALAWVSAANSVTITVVPPPNATEGSTGVLIERFNGFSWTPVVTLTGIYSYSDPGLTPGRPYSYRIMYLNGNGDPSAASTEKSITSPQGVPHTFTGVAQSPASILWSWSVVQDATQYLLHDDAHGLIASIEPPVLTFTETGLAENAMVSRHIHAVTPLGTGDPSAPAAPHTLVRDPSDSEFSLTALTASEVRIVVVPPPGSLLGSTGSEIQRLESAAWIVVKSFSTSYTFVDGGLTTSSTYSYRIRYRNGDAVSTAPSPSKDVMTGPPPPPAPTGFAGVALTPFSIQWSWENFVGGDGFEIHDAAHNVKGGVEAGVLSFIETGLGENALVSRHLHAMNAGGLSPATPSVARYTLVHDALAADLILTPLASDTIDVAIVPPPQATSGATGCLIERSADNLSWTTIKPFSNVYFIRDSGLARSTQYYYRVSFQNGEGVVGLTSPSQTASTLSVTRAVVTTAPKKTRNRNTGVQGIADPGATVTILFNGVPDGTRIADAGGGWSYTATTKNEGEYAVTARASNGTENTGDSNSVSIIIDLTPPAPPTRIRSTGYSSAVDVEWDPSTAADLAGYLIYRKEVGTSTWDTLNSTRLVVGAKYRDITAVNGRRYSFKVVALDDSRND